MNFFEKLSSLFNRLQANGAGSIIILKDGTQLPCAVVKEVGVDFVEFESWAAPAEAGEGADSSWISFITPYVEIQRVLFIADGDTLLGFQQYEVVNYVFS